MKIRQYSEELIRFPRPTRRVVEQIIKEIYKLGFEKGKKWIGNRGYKKTI